MKFRFPISKKLLTIAFQKPFNTSTFEGRSLERRRRIALTALTSSVLKVLTMAVPLITIKVTLDYLNVEVYGLWSAVTAVFALFAFSDLGLGNGLQTKLSQANGKDDLELSRKIISNTYTILLAVAFLLLIVFMVLFPFVNWASFMNAESNETILLASYIVLAIVIPKILSIPVAIIRRTQLALQEGYRSDIWSIIGVLINLALIVLIAKLDLGKITLLAVTSLLPVIVSTVNMVVYFNYQRKELKISLKLFDLKLSKSLLSLGLFFSALSILTTVGLSMDTFIVAKTSNLAEAASFSILYRVTNMFYAVVAILSAPLWGANGEAIARGDYKWVKSNTRRISKIMLSISTIFVIIGLLLAKYVFRIWLGDDFEFSFPTLFWMSIMQILFAFISPYFMVLNASGAVKVQIILFGIFTPLSFALKYYLSLIFGVVAIPFTGFLLYFIIIVIGCYYYTNKQIEANITSKINFVRNETTRG